MKGFGFLFFVALTVICWGVYGPVLHEGQTGMGEGQGRSLLRPIFGVGLAYFLIAVVFPIGVLNAKGEQGGWTLAGFFWSFVAGAIGALGAIGIALANKYGGSPLYVMPLVFGFAPVVNTIVTMLMSRTLKEASKMFYLGVLIVALGASGVMIFTPAASKKHSATEPSVPPPKLTQAVFQEPASTGKTTEQLPAGESPAPNVAAASGATQDLKEQAETPATTSVAEPAGSAKDDLKQPAATVSPSATAGRNFAMIVLSIAMTALCWGAYGPVLHRGQMKMAGSRLRPFLCVGLAYFLLAVIGPLLLLRTFPEPGGWWNQGLFWSILAGAAGAFGALGIIYAFNFGGRPIFVMPLVFGGAPVVNTLVQSLTKGIGEVSPWFYLSLFFVIVGAITVLVCAPKAHPKPAPAAH